MTDELRRRQRAVSLTFWDFVEVRSCHALRTVWRPVGCTPAPARGRLLGFLQLSIPSCSSIMLPRPEPSDSATAFCVFVSQAVARLADLISPPGHEDLMAYFQAKGDVAPQPNHLVYEYYRHVGDAGTARKRDSAELVAPPSRPLEVKLRLLLEYLVVSLREAWGGKDAKDVAAKVLKMAHYLCGGIEMH